MALIDRATDKECEFFELKREEILGNSKKWHRKSRKYLTEILDSLSSHVAFQSYGNGEVCTSSNDWSDLDHSIIPRINSELEVLNITLSDQGDFPQRLWFEVDGGICSAVEKTSTTASFWPQGIECKGLMPIYLLDLAREDWLKGSKGLLTLHIKRDLEKFYIFAALAKDLTTRLPLFSIISKAGNPYPCTIEGDELLNALKPRNTAKELENVLTEIFQSGRVKAIASNLLIKCQGSIASEEP